jgi:hypothetical protein
MALNYGRQLQAKATAIMLVWRIGWPTPLLDDLENARPEGDDWRIAYDMARSYSRAFNDTYTRTFAGRALSTERSGEERIAPELLAETLLRAVTMQRTFAPFRSKNWVSLLLEKIYPAPLKLWGH